MTGLKSTAEFGRRQRLLRFGGGRFADDSQISARAKPQICSTIAARNSSLHYMALHSIVFMCIPKYSYLEYVICTNIACACNCSTM